MENIETGGLLARFWPKKASVERPTFSALSDSVSAVSKAGRAQAGTGKMSENVPKANGPKLMPGIGVLRLQLMDGKQLTIGDLAEALGLTMVQASRLVSKAQKAGHVRKRKAGRFVHVTLVPLSELRK